MERPAFEKLLAMAAKPAALEQTVGYVAACLRRFLKKREQVLICLPDSGTDSLGAIMEQAVLRAEGMPVFWKKDLRWKSLLKLAFSTRVTTVIAPPLIALGLAKLAKAADTPLYIRNVLVAGELCPEWIADGVQWGLDCKVWCCYGVGSGGVVRGCSCDKSRGIHLRDDVYGGRILDGSGEPVPEGQNGEVVFYPLSDPALPWNAGVQARLVTEPCSCGCASPRLMDIAPGSNTDLELLRLEEHLRRWTSVLDCRLWRGPHGLEMEIVVFPGEKLPKLPSCAKQVVRPWEPDRDEPFEILPEWKNVGYSSDSH